MVTNNAIDLSAQGIAYYDGAGTFSVPTITNHAFVIGAASGNIKTLGAATNGQLAIGSNGSDPVLSTLTAGAGISIANAAGSITISNSLGNGRFPITPYVVGPLGQAGYQTIQSAINAADAAGGGLVFVQRGTYTENLVFPAVGNIELFGDSEQATTIVGIHTPPTSGTLNINRCTFSSTTSIFSSAAAGTCAIIVEDCTLTATSGYAFDLLNWTSGGSIGLFNIFSNGANDGAIRNTGGASVFAFSVGLGGGGSNSMTLSGFFLITSSEFSCPISLVTGASGTFDYCEFSYTVTCSNNSVCTFSYGRFNTAANASLTMSSSGAVKLLQCIVNSSNNPAITGAGAGTLTYSDVVFLSNASFAGTLTLATVSWRPYAQAIASTDSTKVGTCTFDSAKFTVDTNGFVSTSGTGIAQTITGDSGGALSPTAGNWNVLGLSGSKTSGSGSTLTIKSPPFSQIGSSATSALNTGEFVTAAVTRTLPASAGLADGDLFIYVCTTASALVIQSVSAQKIRIGNQISSAAGTATSNAIGDSLTLRFDATDGFFYAVSVIGTWTLA